VLFSAETFYDPATDGNGSEGPEKMSYDVRGEGVVR
jgi:hypothetical protein